MSKQKPELAIFSYPAGLGSKIKEGKIKTWIKEVGFLLVSRDIEAIKEWLEKWHRETIGKPATYVIDSDKFFEDIKELEPFETAVQYITLACSLFGGGKAHNMEWGEGLFWTFLCPMDLEEEKAKNILEEYSKEIIEQVSES